jgi:hypothetical protein
MCLCGVRCQASNLIVLSPLSSFVGCSVLRKAHRQAYIGLSFQRLLIQRVMRLL